jgi:hypothetical protein
VTDNALLVTSCGSTPVSGIWPANALMAASISAASLWQSLLQQLWNSLRSRTTSRELAGVSRSILAFAPA